jgi:hypothetical protein
MLSAREYAKVCAFMGWPIEQSAVGLAKDHGLELDEARELIMTAVRQRQEIDIEDTHDELQED